MVVLTFALHVALALAGDRVEPPALEVRWRLVEPRMEDRGVLEGGREVRVVALPGDQPLGAVCEGRTPFRRGLAESALVEGTFSEPVAEESAWVFPPGPPTMGEWLVEPPDCRLYALVEQPTARGAARVEWSGEDLRVAVASNPVFTAEAERWVEEAPDRATWLDRYLTLRPPGPHPPGQGWPAPTGPEGAMHPERVRLDPFGQPEEDRQWWQADGGAEWALRGPRRVAVQARWLDGPRPLCLEVDGKATCQEQPPWEETLVHDRALEARSGHLYGRRVGRPATWTVLLPEGAHLLRLEGPALVRASTSFPALYLRSREGAVLSHETVVYPPAEPEDRQPLDPEGDPPVAPLFGPPADPGPREEDLWVFADEQHPVAWKVTGTEPVLWFAHAAGQGTSYRIQVTHPSGAVTSWVVTPRPSPPARWSAGGDPWQHPVALPLEPGEGRAQVRSTVPLAVRVSAVGPTRPVLAAVSEVPGPSEADLPAPREPEASAWRPPTGRPPVDRSGTVVARTAVGNADVAEEEPEDRSVLGRRLIQSLAVAQGLNRHPLWLLAELRGDVLLGGNLVSATGALEGRVLSRAWSLWVLADVEWVDRVDEPSPFSALHLRVRLFAEGNPGPHWRVVGWLNGVQRIPIGGWDAQGWPEDLMRMWSAYKDTHTRTLEPRLEARWLPGPWTRVVGWAEVGTNEDLLDGLEHATLSGRVELSRPAVWMALGGELDLRFRDADRQAAYLAPEVFARAAVTAWPGRDLAVQIRPAARYRFRYREAAVLVEVGLIGSRDRGLHDFMPSRIAAPVAQEWFRDRAAERRRLKVEEEEEGEP